MQWLLDLITNKALWCALTAWFVAQALKIPTHFLTHHEWDWGRIHGSGGMPSSHSSLCVSITVYLACKYGLGSDIVVLSAVLSSIVMYDASGVRRQTGKQAEVINEILRRVFVDGEPISDDNLKELVGHKPIEVLFGAIFGIVIGLIFGLT